VTSQASTGLERALGPKEALQLVAAHDAKAADRCHDLAVALGEAAGYLSKMPLGYALEGARMFRWR
jgi:hypothetical protein